MLRAPHGLGAPVRDSFGLARVQRLLLGERVGFFVRWLDLVGLFENSRADPVGPMLGRALASLCPSRAVCTTDALAYMPASEMCHVQTDPGCPHLHNPWDHTRCTRSKNSEAVSSNSPPHPTDHSQPSRTHTPKAPLRASAPTHARTPPPTA